MIEDPYTSAASSGPQPIQPIGDIAEWYRKLLTSPSGVFYEDTHLQVQSARCPVWAVQDFAGFAGQGASPSCCAGM